MVKKNFIILMVIVLMIGSCSSVLALEPKTTLEVVQKSSEIRNNQNYISKTIVDSNSNIGEVTIELKLPQIKPENENIDTEVILVMDNSSSMASKAADGVKRKTKVIEAAKNLTDKLFARSDSIKVGMLMFKEGSKLSIATNTMCNLTNNKSEVIASLDALSKKNLNAGTNIIAGITAANNLFSQNCSNKVIILLTDGIPNYDLSGNNNPTSNQKKEQIYNNTKQGLIDISNSGVQIISMMTGLAENSNDSSKKEVVEQIFGTQENPTAGLFYNISDLDIGKIVSEDIYTEVDNKMTNSIHSIKLVDYFPKEIIDNFEFSYEGLPSCGTVSSKIDETDRSIVWDIGEIKQGVEVTLRYKLKIKDMKNRDLFNKVLATNERVIVSYQDLTAKKYSITLEDSPKIKLVERSYNTEHEENEEETADDDVLDNQESEEGTDNAEHEENEEETADDDVLDNQESEEGTDNTEHEENEEEQKATLRKEDYIIDEQKSNNEDDKIIDNQESKEQKNINVENNKQVVNQTKNKLDTSLEETGKDTTTSWKLLPKTGDNERILILIALVSLNSVIVYKKYKNIK